MWLSVFRSTPFLEGSVPYISILSQDKIQTNFAIINIVQVCKDEIVLAR